MRSDAGLLATTADYVMSSAVSEAPCFGFVITDFRGNTIMHKEGSGGTFHC